MTRADDLRARLVTVVNGYLLDHLDPTLADDEDEALHEAGDIVDMVLQVAYEQTHDDHKEIWEAVRQVAFEARQPDGTPVAEPKPTEQAWWECWPAVLWKHHPNGLDRLTALIATGREPAPAPEPTVHDRSEYETRPPARERCPDPDAETHRSPDCKAGKHGGCTGDGWCGEEDAIVSCPCWCHTDGSIGNAYA